MEYVNGNGDNKNTPSFKKLKDNYYEVQELCRKRLKF